MKMERTECSETSAYKIQMLGNYPEESVQHSYAHCPSLNAGVTADDQSYFHYEMRVHVPAHNNIVRFGHKELHLMGYGHSVRLIKFKSSSSSALQPWEGLGLLLRFHNNIFLQGEVVSLMPNPQPGGPIKVK